MLITIGEANSVLKIKYLEGVVEVSVPRILVGPVVDFIMLQDFF